MCIRDRLIEKLRDYRGLPQELSLPSAPKQFIQYLEEDNRPQVTLDVDYENGMGISVGRLREDSLYDFKFVGLSHNTVRGAAGGAIPVSYTHLDVYKRQVLLCIMAMALYAVIGVVEKVYQKHF